MGLYTTITNEFIHQPTAIVKRLLSRNRGKSINVFVDDTKQKSEGHVKITDDKTNVSGASIAT